MKSRNTARVHRASGAALCPLITLLLVVLLLPSARLKADEKDDKITAQAKEIARQKARADKAEKENATLRAKNESPKHSQGREPVETEAAKEPKFPSGATRSQDELIGRDRHPGKKQLQVVTGKASNPKQESQKQSSNSETSKTESATSEKNPIVLFSNTGPASGFHLKVLQRNDTPAKGEQDNAQGQFIANDVLKEYSFGAAVSNGFRIRKDFNDLKAFELVGSGDKTESTAMSNDQTQDTEPQPATFNWSKDYIAHTEGWKAQGVLYLPMTIVDDDNRPRSLIPSFPGAQSSWTIFYPAIRFDRDTSKDGTANPENSLDFLIGADFNFFHLGENGERPLPDNPGAVSNFAYIIHMAAGMHTDFSFHRPKPLWEMSYDPIVNETWGINTFNYGKLIKKLGDGDDFEYQNGSGPIMYKITLRGLTQATAQPDSAGDVKQGDSTFPLGFQTGLTITPRNSSWAVIGKAQLSAMYTGEWDTQHGDEYNGLFEATLNVPFANSQAGWTLSYKNGNDLTSHQKVSELDLAFSIKL